jgi:hypothetical protein
MIAIDTLVHKSFGGIGMISRDLAKGRPDLAYLYLLHIPAEADYRFRFLRPRDSKIPWGGLQLSLHRRRLSGPASASLAGDRRSHHSKVFHSDGLCSPALGR